MVLPVQMMFHWTGDAGTTFSAQLQLYLFHCQFIGPPHDASGDVTSLPKVATVRCHGKWLKDGEISTK